MEEPEIAIPPHTQKCIVDNIRNKSAQALFTSHSPYVLEEFKPEQIIVLRREEGVLSGIAATYPPAVKVKKYRSEFRTRFCEALLARRVLITEGRTEYDAFPVVARRLHDLHPTEFKTLEALGIATIDAESDSQIASLGAYFGRLGKTTFSVCDKQSAEQKQLIEAAITVPFEGPEKGFEKTILNGTAEAALRRFAPSVVPADGWPTHFSSAAPTASASIDDIKTALLEYFKWTKGSGTVADLLSQCTRNEMPSFVVDTLLAIQIYIEPPALPVAEAVNSSAN